ncbi:hypothetical protein COCSUDRAFT_34668 [Coccomyxa subellipsoidea C-169]|uniref:Protein kinase domain-containing protein n=1 Tax=Coccomyxa subellipsoidea (strain C-169) TaxID=574566 RepID=I0Z8S5_COCSC|nr:hypothetical protein COCSUDRAFT_34668 [Coccomyxa subellipsoidea C-169]EIE27044.1 hypothetical protein COCSUDRAFT_34668 [Coccomyxa subellipsoidea C-169]|eukprot:XP_005651588.1 hypothetical protein COCSUDRAFT_34668 [Coccomyxa subellipsoidea C-169]
MEKTGSEEAGTRFSRVSTASFRGERGDATVRLPSGFPMQEGAQLAETCFVGKMLGEGIQGAVFELVDKRGRPLNLVLKSMRSGGAAWLSSMLPSMEREWAIGQRLGMHCRTTAGAHPGFMGVGAALIVEDVVKDPRKVSKGDEGKRGSGTEQGKSKPRVRGRFRGMVLEKLNGRTLASIMGSKHSGVQDVHYLRQALLQVLTALAEAQKLGFRHWDLRMTNIMEHHPLPTQAAEKLPEAASAQVASAGQPDAVSQPDSHPPQTESIKDAPEVWSAIELTQSGAQHAAKEHLSLREQSQNGCLDGSRGAAGGSGSSVPAQEGASAKEGMGTDREGLQCVWKIIDYGHADFGDKTLQYDGLCIGGPPFDPEDGLPKWMLESGLPKIPLAEKCYRQFWWRKGDVYRLLMSLQNIIDGSTWPKDDKRRVNELIGLIHHVTGASASQCTSQTIRTMCSSPAPAASGAVLTAAATSAAGGRCGCRPSLRHTIQASPPQKPLPCPSSHVLSKACCGTS